MKSSDKKVQDFLDGIMLVDPEKYDSLLEMRELLYSVYPKADERMMYGGILFSLNGEDFSGLFIRQKHISFEFSNGHSMKDPGHFLEGKGKFRRHLKIRNKADIEKKEALTFIKQAI